MNFIVNSMNPSELEGQDLINAIEYCSYKLRRIPDDIEMMRGTSVYNSEDSIIKSKRIYEVCDDIADKYSFLDTIQEHLKTVSLAMLDLREKQLREMLVKLSNRVNEVGL